MKPAVFRMNSHTTVHTSYVVFAHAVRMNLAQHCGAAILKNGGCDNMRWYGIAIWHVCVHSATVSVRG